MPRPLEEAVVAITGASSGIGRLDVLRAPGELAAAERAGLGGTAV